MGICGMCHEQAKKAQRGNPHQYLTKIEGARIFKGGQSRGYEEQDYQCEICRAKFTRSTNKNDLAWTLWQG
jgi:hypothetical protein